MSSNGEVTWTFLTAHARVLIMVARNPDLRVRDLAAACKVTERTVQGVIADLEEAGYLVRTREGRRNRYRVMPGMHFRHPAEAEYEVAGLVELLLGRPAPATGTGGVDGVDGGARRSDAGTRRGGPT